MLTTDTENRPVVTRRAHRRVSLRLDLDCWTAGRSFQATSGNLGEGGIYLMTSEQLRLGAAVELLLRVPGHTTPHYIRAGVAWTAGADGDRRGYGLRFVELTGVAAREILAYIAASAPVAPTTA